MAANWSSLTIDPRDLERNQTVTLAFDQSASFQTNQSEYLNTIHSSFSSWPNTADVQASWMPSALAGPNMDLGPSAIDMSLDPIEFEFNDVMGAQVDTHRGWSGPAGYQETTHFQQQNAGHSFQYPLPSFVFQSYEHDPNQGPQEFNLDSQGLTISQPPAKLPPRHQMGYSVPPPTGPKIHQQPATSSTRISVRSSETRLSRATIDRKLKSRRRPMAQKRVPPAHGTAQGKRTKSDGASSQSTTSSSECSTNVDGLKACTPKFQEAIAMAQESIKPFSPPFRRKAAALIDQVAELVKQLNQVAIDEELYGYASSNVEVDTQPSVASSSDDYISNPELTDSESNTDNTSVSSTPRQLVVENETPAFAEDDQQEPIHPPCAQCRVKTLYFCTRQDKKAKKPCRYAHHVLAEWKRHMKTQKHSQRERFMCVECPNSPPAIDINGHSVCQFCEESFPTLGASLRAHYTQCQSAQRANKSYGRQDKLIEHLRSHPGVINLSLAAAAGRYTMNSEWPDECGFCGKIFSSFDEMLDDIAKHFQAGLNMSSWKLPFQPSKDSHPGFQPHSKGGDSDSDDDMDDNDSYPSHQSSGSQTKEASSFSSSAQSKRSNGNQKSGSSYQGGRRRCYLVPQATLDNSAEPIGSRASGHATTSVALERYLNDEEEPVELRLSQISSDMSNSSPMFSAVATEDDLVSNVPDPECVMHSLTLQEHKGCFKEAIPSTGHLQVPPIGFSGFGFGTGDFFALGQLALDVYKSCKTASEDLKNLSSEILSLLEILQALRALQSEHSLPEWNQGTLANLSSTCRAVLQDVQAQVEKRKSFKSDRKRMLLFDRLKWVKYDIDVLTTRLASNRATFEIFLMAASLSSGGLQSALTSDKLRQTTRQGACISNDGTREYGVTNHISKVFTGNGNETHPGLIVTDGAVIPTALGVNLFATASVLAERSVKYTAKCHIFQNINMEPNDVLDLFGSPHQVNSDKQILHRTETYRISEAKDLIRATRAAKSNGDKIEDYQTAAKTARGVCEEARVFLSVKAYLLQVDEELSPSSKDPNLEKGALNDEAISQGVPKYQWLASRISHQQAIKYKSLLDIRAKHSEALRWGSLDLIQGKGTGLFILLHGVPGIGKTATAEANAQANSKPLFKTTIGDLGMIPERLEILLREKFHLASIWDYILLLDEADTFFAQRSQADMATNKNTLVSVFLRVLDYYNSILFLTTNRASVLDEAFKSRIHYKIYYPDLTLEQTLDTWKLNINRVRRIGGQSESCSARSATAANIQRRESAGVTGLKTAPKISREQGQSSYGSETKRKPAYVNDIDEGKRKRISIISTTGPKENTQETINKLRKVGQNVVRMNFSHPPYEPHKSLIDSVRENGRYKDCRRVPSPSVPQHTSGFTYRRPAATYLPTFQLPSPDHCRSHIRDTGKEDLSHPTSSKGKEKEPKYGAYYNAGAQLRQAHFKPVSKMQVNAKTNDGKTALYLVAKNGHEAMVQLLLDHKAEVNATAGDGNTALHFAAENGEEAMAKLFFANDGDQKLRDKMTPLLLSAAENGREAIGRLLLGNGVDVNAEKYGIKAIHEAALRGHEEMVRLLLEGGAKVNTTEAENRVTALHLAARTRREAVVRLLLENEANVVAEEKDGTTALHEAARRGHEAVVWLLLEKGANVTTRKKDGTTGLHEASYRMPMRDRMDQDEEDSIHGAAEIGHVSVVRLLLEKEAEIAATKNDRTTPLHVAAGNGYLSVVRLLLEEKADIAAKKNNGTTALHEAVGNGRVSVVRLLKEEGADVAAKNEDGTTAMDMVYERCKGDRGGLHRLWEKGIWSYMDFFLLEAPQVRTKLESVQGLDVKSAQNEEYSQNNAR